MKLLSVTWLDSKGCNPHWENAKEIKRIKPCKIRSVGYVMKETGVFITLSPNFFRNDDGEIESVGDIIIPKGCITKMKTLKKRPRRFCNSLP